MSTQVVAGVDTPCGYQQITSLSAAQALTVPANARWALIVPQTQAVRWRDDADPSATVGIPLVPGQVLQYTGNLKSIKFIEQTASAALNIAYYG